MPEAFLQITDVKTHFPVERGVIFRQRTGTVKAVDGVSLSLVKGLQPRPTRAFGSPLPIILISLRISSTSLSWSAVTNNGTEEDYNDLRDRMSHNIAACLRRT